MSNLINNVRISNKAFFKKEEKLSFKNQGLLTGAFSLGAVSLISACSNDSAGGGGTGEVEPPPPPPPPPPPDGEDPYESAVSLDALERPVALVGGTGNGIMVTRGTETETSPSSGVYGVTMTVAFDGNNTATFGNVAYVGPKPGSTPGDSTLSSTPIAKIYDDIDGAGGKDILLYSSAFYQDAPLSDPTVATNPYGGLTILWDVPTAQGTVDTSALKYLHISGDRVNSFNNIDGAVEILKINAGDKNDLMVTATLATVADDRASVGAIHIFWDIADYKGRTTDADEGKVNFSISDSGENFLSIYGESGGDQIQAPKLFKLKDANYDLVFSSGGATDSVGAIYILWDVASYSSGRKTIDLAAASGTANYADQGLLTIDGNSAGDLLQLTNDFNPFHHVDGNKNFDLVIHQNSERVGTTHVGAIYILWDIGSYASTEHKNIILGPDPDVANATYGLFSIIGEAGKGLQLNGADNIANYPLLKGSDNSIAQDLKGNEDGKKDIAFKYDGKIYVIFGEVMTEEDNLNFIKSKTIDLADVKITDANAAIADEGYLNYDFDGAGEVNVGHVFDNSSGGITSLDDITVPAPPPPPALSETFESHDYWIA